MFWPSPSLLILAILAGSMLQRRVRQLPAFRAVDRRSKRCGTPLGSRSHKTVKTFTVKKETYPFEYVYFILISQAPRLYTPESVLGTSMPLSWNCFTS